MNVDRLMMVLVDERDNHLSPIYYLFFSCKTYTTQKVKVGSMKTIQRHKVKSYLNLIEELLSCPHGEEWILLRKHSELVNLELVEAMEQTAKYLSMQGKIKAATYLHNWAGKLHHIISENIPVTREDSDKTHAYVELIQALLSCPEGNESEILAANQDLIDPELIRVMNQVASQMTQEDSETANYLYSLAAELDRTWIEHHEFEPSLKKEIALDPWLDTEESLSETDEPTEIASQMTEQLKPSPIQPQVDSNSFVLLLTKVASSLERLETTLARLQPQNPLWYMDVLEKAIASDWILSTDEVEKLIGVKPHCEHHKTAYHRGSWVFTKVGKVGAQIGWKVGKNC